MGPPRIMFDDGSRIMQESSSGTSQEADAATSIRGSIPIDAYYETARVAKEAVEKIDWAERTFRARLLRCCADGNCVEDLSNNDDDGFICRVALQFPDELLSDASQVTWMMEEAISIAYRAKFHEKLNNLKQEQVQVVPPRIQQHLESPPLVFILGDSTYGSCCPDEVAAQHLNADVLVHYGYACLSSCSERIPVVYAFGIADAALVERDNLGSSVKRDDTNGNFWKECVDLVSKQLSVLVHENVDTSMNELNLTTMDSKAPNHKLLLLYDVRYHHAIKHLQLQLERIGCVSSVVVGAIPEQQFTTASRLQNRKGRCCKDTADCVSSTYCKKQASEDKSALCSYESCCQLSNEVAHESNTASSPSIKAEATCCKLGGIERPDESNNAAANTSQLQRIPRSIGGLEIPDDLDLSQHTLLYVGDDLNIDSSDGSHDTRLLHILLRCNAPDGCQSIWSYSPKHHNLNCDILNSPLSPSNPTTLSTFLSRTLRRRYFLIQKAKLATTIGILIGTTTTSFSFQRLLSRIRHRIQSTGRTAYTFAVGKLASASSKVSNFAEIDCFVLIACQESISKFWRMEREDMIVPVITPLELDVALGLREWDGRYSCDFGDLVRWDKEDGVEDEFDRDESGSGFESNKPSIAEDENGQKSDDDDEPFFSMISGKYEHSRAPKHSSPTDLRDLPGQGQLMEYRSEAAEFLKNREYQGLEANVGQTEAKKAVFGKAGIASNYGEEM